MRKLLKLVALGESFPRLDHHLRLLLMFAPGNVLSVLNLITCREDV